MNCILWHNPRCSKSRGALDLLRERGIKPTIRTYLDDPPGAAEITEVVRKLGIAPRTLLRSGEDAYRELGLGDESLSDEALITAMAAHPRLIERPILVCGDRAVIGRPPERVLELID